MKLVSSMMEKSGSKNYDSSFLMDDKGTILVSLIYDEGLGTVNKGGRENSYSSHL